MGRGQEFLESSAEVPVKDRIDDGVEAAVAVPDPEEEFEERLRDAAAFSKHRFQAIGKEEWEPAEYKSSNDKRKDKGESALPGLHQPIGGEGQVPASALMGTGGK